MQPAATAPTQAVQPSAPPPAARFAIGPALVVVTMALPWLIGWTWGPLPDMVQRLGSGLCAAVLLLAWANWGRAAASATVLRCIALGWLLAASLSALMALAQYAGALAPRSPQSAAAVDAAPQCPRSAPLARAEDTQPAPHAACAGAPASGNSTWDVPALFDTALRSLISPSPAGTAYANLRQRNQFATLTSIGLLSLLALLHLAALARTRAATQPPRPAPASSCSAPTMAPSTRNAAPHTPPLPFAARLLWGTALLLLALGNAASGSRTGAMQWLLIAGLALLWRRNAAHSHTATPPWRWAALALLAYTAAALLLPLALQAATGASGHSVFARFQEDSGSQSRSVLWANVLTLIADKPWLGWGWGGLKWAHFIYPYPGARFDDILDNAHNLPLHLAVELGLPLALLLCSAALVWLLRSQPWRAQQPAAQLAWGVLAVLGLHSLLEYPLWYGPFQLALLVCGALLVASKRKPPPTPLTPAPGYLAVTLAAVLLCATSYAAWDYGRIAQLYLQPEQRAARWRDAPWEHAQRSVLFRGEVQFAYVTTTPVTPDTVDALYPAALESLHFSPEPKVIAVVLECARMLDIQTPQLAHIRQQSLRVYPASAPSAEPAPAPMSAPVSAPMSTP